MSTKLLWRGIVGLFIIIAVSGCSARTDSNTVGNAAAASGGPFLSFYVGDTEFTGGADKLLSGAYRTGITLRDLLSSSGLVEFAQDDKSIVSVNGVSFMQDMDWELQLDGKKLEHDAWDHVVDPEDHIGLVAWPYDSSKNIQSVILYVNGGTEQPEISHSYIMPFTADSSVRSLLEECGFVKISEDNNNVIEVKDYVLLTDEQWRVKVNKKLLMENGMDMKLRPQDEVELALTLR
ncbi:hypothetical protein [Paenibacillus sp. sgz500958]|uniref:hypothetical protein n=1 Tax=Paenibacillus sp. sgz500958 TaxID=3242475 RepID=UPI0036D276BE